MLFTKKYHLGHCQRALVLKDSVFQKILTTGVHRIPCHQVVEVFDISVNTRFIHPLAEWLRGQAPAVIDSYFHVADTADDEVALRFEHEKLVEIIPPASRRLYWKSDVAVQIEKVTIGDGIDVDAVLFERFKRCPKTQRHAQLFNDLLQVQVPTGFVGVLRSNQQIERLLSPGEYAFWTYSSDIVVDMIDMRWQTMNVSGQEILTRDKVGLRINLVAMWRYTDVLLAFETSDSPQEHLYCELQLGLRAVVGTRTLDELLDNKQAIDTRVAEYLASRLGNKGLEVSDSGAKDIILPGDMKDILAQVVAAEKTAQANVIKCRAETAATRSLLNTAKVMEENPTALRLKELETLERVAERIDRISVFGGLDQVLNGLVSIPAAQVGSKV